MTEQQQYQQPPQPQSVNSVAEVAPMQEPVSSPQEVPEKQYTVVLGTAAIDGFIEIIEEVIEPLSEKLATIENPSRFDMTGVILQMVRKHALPSMVSWMSEISGEPREELDRSVMGQAKILKACREQGLGDFLGEWLALLGPIIR